jgi:hypothetical protein
MIYFDEPSAAETSGAIGNLNTYVECGWCSQMYHPSALNYDGTEVPICIFCDGTVEVPPYESVIPKPEAVRAESAPRRGRSGSKPVPGESARTVGGENSAFVVYQNADQKQMLKTMKAKEMYAERKKAEQQGGSFSGIEALLAAFERVNAEPTFALQNVCKCGRSCAKDDDVCATCRACGA